LQHHNSRTLQHHNQSINQHQHQSFKHQHQLAIKEEADMQFLAVAAAVTAMQSLVK